MGWTFYHTDRSTADELRRMCDADDGAWGAGNRPTSGRILDVATKGGAAYAAYQITFKDTGEHIVIALVFLVKRGFADRNGHNFGYKSQDEFCGPCDTDAPERILNLLTPLDEVAKQLGMDPSGPSYIWATKWRESCWENLRRAKAMPKITSGLRLSFPEPLRFTDGADRQRFVAEKTGRTVRWICLDTGARVKLTKRAMARAIFEAA